MHYVAYLHYVILAWFINEQIVEEGLLMDIKATVKIKSVGG